MPGSATDPRARPASSGQVLRGTYAGIGAHVHARGLADSEVGVDGQGVPLAQACLAGVTRGPARCG